MEIITESEHSNPKLRIPFGNCWGENQDIFCSVCSLDVGNKNDSMLKNLSNFYCKICYWKSLKTLTKYIAEFPNEIIDFGLLCGANRTGGALPFLFGNNQDVVEK